jgi:hypothetical protein
VTEGHATILATGKCVAACRGAVLQQPRRAARNVLCIRKEVPAMFAHRQTPPRVALYGQAEHGRWLEKRPGPPRER